MLSAGSIKALAQREAEREVVHWHACRLCQPSEWAKLGLHPSDQNRHMERCQPKRRMSRRQRSAGNRRSQRRLHRSRALRACAIVSKRHRHRWEPRDDAHVRTTCHGQDARERGAYGRDAYERDGRDAYERDGPSSEYADGLRDDLCPYRNHANGKTDFPP
jgi:hypothetical protein